MYKFTPRMIADMTPLQQLALFAGETGADSVYFDTEEEYRQWLMSR